RKQGDARPTNHSAATTSPGPADATPTYDGVDVDAWPLVSSGNADNLGAACYVDLPDIDPEAVEGTHLFLETPHAVLARGEQSPPAAKFGPGRAGPYTLHPNTRKGALVFFVAFNEEREQSEWIVGPDDVYDFAATAEVWAATAAKAMPGSDLIPASQRGGAK